MHPPSVALHAPRTQISNFRVLHSGRRLSRGDSLHLHNNPSPGVRHPNPLLCITPCFGQRALQYQFYKRPSPSTPPRPEKPHIHMRIPAPLVENTPQSVHTRLAFVLKAGCSQKETKSTHAPARACLHTLLYLTSRHPAAEAAEHTIVTAGFLV